MHTDLKLPDRLNRLYVALKGKGDVSMDALCEAIEANLENTPSQQWLGPYITRLNRRIAKQGLAVKPGALKGTYRLIVV